MPLFATEGGKQPLAQALFESFKNRIRCPTCPGNKGNPGFTLDSAGRCAKEGRARRYFSCQLSSGVRSKEDCRRASCSRYIQLASEQLKPTEFADVVRRTQATFEAGSEQHQTLGTYLSDSPPRVGPDASFFKQFCTPAQPKDSCDRDKPPTPSATPTLRSPADPAILKRKADNAPDELPEHHKKTCMGRGSDASSPIVDADTLRGQIRPLTDQLASILTTVCDLFEAVRSESRSPGTPERLTTKGSFGQSDAHPTTPSPSALDLDFLAQRAQFANRLAVQFKAAGKTRKKLLREQAKSVGVFALFENEVQKINGKHQGGAESGLREHQRACGGQVGARN